MCQLRHSAWWVLLNSRHEQAPPLSRRSPEPRGMCRHVHLVEHGCALTRPQDCVPFRPASETDTQNVLGRRRADTHLRHWTVTVHGRVCEDGVWFETPQVVITRSRRQLKSNLVGLLAGGSWRLGKLPLGETPSGVSCTCICAREVPLPNVCVAADEFVVDMGDQVAALQVRCQCGARLQA